jgi:hypothetical protein
VERQAHTEIERPRSALQLIGATFALYRDFPWLFLILAAIVVIPYQGLDAISTFAITGGWGKALAIVTLYVADFALVLPLVSALHVFAVDDVREGRRPDIASVARRGIASMPIVSPAVFFTWLGIFGGLLVLIVPGVVLWVRWAVVAQTASLGANDWKEAMNRSEDLGDGRNRHVLALLVMTLVITTAPDLALSHTLGSTLDGAGPFVAHSALAVLTTSFTALATAFLYYDLKARMETEGPGNRAPEPAVHPSSPTEHGNVARPAGWYINPDRPSRMRYWPADGSGLWSTRTTKTPRKTLAEWRDHQAAERPEDPV